MNPTATTAKTFEVGDVISCRSAGDHECVFTFTVLRRTAKFVTLGYQDRTYRVGIRINDNGGVEYCHPFGTYSMAATLRADG